ncbi:hypothetical protein PPL_09072 [Heterostelium album PN500]|uniref:Uncharacterized protein n=1 Tax=Heterostelium pallidum (strain ATCC 26659 / Pp 5 / PN500) TaxID=670386 RepID=D3BKJ1_HETP5|nr:hypothetical protein PPL_09072 [Heterostelium album PN500]EFA78421.1 hypothetical protein PPL_09072 [Heterostelium album PN500]|eukprot:XP_020430546.1 hypothetical protein PPL_09072 [Heterostelium album PN500]
MSFSFCDPSVRDTVVMLGGQFFSLPYHSLYETLETGVCQTSRSLNGKSILQFCLENRQVAKDFSTGMTGLAVEAIPLLAKLGEYGKFEVVCDIGGSAAI